MRLLLVEHFAAVGSCDSLTGAGLAMLQALAEDFAALGVEVMVPLHESVGGFRVDGVQVHRLSGADSLREPMNQFARTCDAALIVAPEQDQLLERWTQRMESMGLAILGSASSAVAVCSDKFQLMSQLRQAGLAVPVTFLRESVQAEVPAELGDDLIVKPRWGAGCCDTHRLPAGLLSSAKKVGHQIVQEYVPGQAVSLCALIHGQQILPLKPCRQKIRIDPQGLLSYEGGQGGQEVAGIGGGGARAWRLASAALASITGLGGFVGVDLVLGDAPDQDRLIEINPRVTMSYLMLRAICRQNLATGFLEPLSHLSWNDATVQMDAQGRITVETGDER